MTQSIIMETAGENDSEGRNNNNTDNNNNSCNQVENISPILEMRDNHKLSNQQADNLFSPTIQEYYRLRDSSTKLGSEHDIYFSALKKFHTSCMAYKKYKNPYKCYKSIKCTMKDTLDLVHSEATTASGGSEEDDTTTSPAQRVVTTTSLSPASNSSMDMILSFKESQIQHENEKMLHNIEQCERNLPKMQLWVTNLTQQYNLLKEANLFMKNSTAKNAVNNLLNEYEKIFAVTNNKTATSSSSK